MRLTLPPLWPHQRAAHPKAMIALRDFDRVVFCSPTGSGKTRSAMEIAKDYLDFGKRVELITNRKMLAEQLIDVFGNAGFHFGRRMSGHYTDDTKNLQISMMQTLDSKTKKYQWDHFPADIVIIDEAHIQRGNTVHKMMHRRQIEHGSKFLGLTGTSLGLAEMGYEHQVVAATNTELIKGKFLLPCETFAPSEPDLRRCRRVSTSMSDKQVEGFMKLRRVVGDIVKEIRDKNSELKPMIAYAPSVNSSRWMCEMLNAAGIKSAHIDGESIYYGERTAAGDPIYLETNSETRTMLKDQLSCGEIKCVTNRFVLREGIDIPELYMGILATIFTGVQTYIQSAGRFMRANGHDDHCRLLDFGGNYWRFGSANMDRVWELDMDEAEYERRHKEKQSKGEAPEPTVCKACHKVFPDFEYGKECPHCKHIARERFRRIIQERGELILQTRVNGPKKKSDKTDEQKMWDSCYYRAKASGRLTFNQVRGLYRKESGTAPPLDKLVRVPSEDIDWNRRVKDVPQENLIMERFDERL